MQFKHPEILYFLALLIIPIIVHLFQLQRFEKVAFTNVAFLKKIATQTRKSSRIKKWLILLTRLLSLAALVLAFAQPYFSNNVTFNRKQHTVIYLDNSLSMNAKGNKGKLLQIASQDIIENTATKSDFSLITNDNFYKNIGSDELKSVLLNLKSTTKQLAFDDVLLTVANENKKQINTTYQNLIISDFQNINSKKLKNINSKYTFIKLDNQQKNNIAIDSVYLSKNTTTNFNISILIKNQGEAKKNIPIAIYNKNTLISKQTFNIDADTQKQISFSLQKTKPFLGKLIIQFDDTFNFDNTFYFSLNENEKINVLVIGDNNTFLSKIYAKNEFNFTSVSGKNINYNALPKQQLIILNELENIPQTLANSINDFINKGGNLVVIPNKNTVITSYNNFFKTLNVKPIISKEKKETKITKIHFSHPVLKNVFNKKVANFQYPKVQQYFKTAHQKASNAILSFENNMAFIEQITLKNATVFWVSAPLNKQNSNFTNSPLIVPTFYNIGQQSLKLSKLFYRVGTKNTVDINTQLKKDGVLTLASVKESFVPLQQTFQSKVTLTTDQQPLYAENYAALKQKDTLTNLAFNTPKQESNLSFLNVNAINNENITVSSSVKNTLQKINQSNKVEWLWKWFLIAVVVFLLLEILILKFFKV